jgi:chemotaxis protein CheX
MSQQATTKSALDAKLVNPVIASTIEVLDTMASTKVVLQNIQPQKDYNPTGDISAVIGILGEDGEGMISLSFSYKLADTIVSRLLGLNSDEISKEDRSDGIGEIVNMISGNAKTALSQSTTTPYKLTLPTLIQGSGHEVASRPKNSPYLVIIFESEGETFHLQMSFKTF